MDAVLEMSTISSKGQITIPASVRSAIGVRAGDKVLFVRRDDGSISLFNQNMMAMHVAMDAFEGAAEEAGLQDEEDLAAIVREARADLYAKATGASA
ncbi:MAG: AbrB/MazE/SpoVT family DNA-binding domain-containing protein [Atopobiaceae bacterium]|nr:AbrB/MazE/SpoVT family DNA-binding domain-containing protein [Atopobiaceae bacterium]